MNDNITEVKINDIKWLFIEVLDDEHVLIELHEKDNVETLRDSEHLVIKNNELIRL